MLKQLKLEPNQDSPTKLRRESSSSSSCALCVCCAGPCSWQPLQACGRSGNAKAAQPENQAKGKGTWGGAGGGRTEGWAWLTVGAKKWKFSSLGTAMG